MADETPPLRPPLPIAKRLNRNALIVVALVLGLTAVVVVVTMRPAAREAGTTALVDAAHWATEWPWLRDAAELVGKTNVETRISTAVTDAWTFRSFEGST